MEENEIAVCEFKGYENNKPVYKCNLTPYHIISNSECWKFINETNEKYAITLCGKIISLKHYEFNFIKPSINGRGQYKINLSLQGNSKGTTLSKLMVETFIGPRPICKAQVRHIDQNPGHNYIDNLKWDRPWKTKLKSKDISEIKELRFKRKLRFREIAEIYNVSLCAIQFICQNKSWKFLQKVKE